MQHIEHHSRPDAPGNPSSSSAADQPLQTNTAGPSSSSMIMSGNWQPPGMAAQASTSAGLDAAQVPAAPPQPPAAAAAPHLVVEGRAAAIVPAPEYYQSDESDHSTPPDDEGFPSQLAFLSKLKTLSMSCCDIEAVPPIIGSLTSLKSLVLSGNRPHATRHAFFFLPSDCRSLVVRYYYYCGTSSFTIVAPSLCPVLDFLGQGLL